MASIINSGKFLARDGNGVPYAGGELDTYLAGSGGATPQATYTDSSLSVANANPVILDADGRADVWVGDGSYLLILKDSLGNTVWTIDDYKDKDTELDYLSISTVSALVALSIEAGETAATQGYYAAGDGGGAVYYIKTAAAFGKTPDGYNDYELANGNVAVYQGHISNDTDAFTYAELTTAKPGYGGSFPGAYGDDPANKGLQFEALNSAGVKKIFAAIQAEIEDATAGSEAGRLHFLVNDVDFSQVVGTIETNGGLIWGPGSPSYKMDVAGKQDVGAGVGTAIFGERMSVVDPDNVDMRGLAVRNIKATDLNSLDYRASINFSILSDAGRERPTGAFKLQYSDRADNNEHSYAYPITLVGGVQTSGPFFYNGGVGFDAANLDEAHKLDYYEEGTWDPFFTCDTTDPVYTGLAQGEYIRIGRQVTATIYMAQTSTVIGVGSYLRIGGLPFAAQNKNTGNGMVSVNSLFTSSSGLAAASVRANTTEIELYKYAGSDPRDGIYTVLAPADLRLTTGALRLTVIYFVD